MGDSNSTGHGEESVAKGEQGYNHSMFDWIVLGISNAPQIGWPSRHLASVPVVSVVWVWLHASVLVVSVVWVWMLVCQ